MVRKYYINTCVDLNNLSYYLFITVVTMTKPTSVVVNDLFTPKKVSSQFSVRPELQYAGFDIIRPIEPSNLDTDENIVVDIRAGKDEFISIPIHHMFVETSTIKSCIVSNTPTKSLTQPYENISWPPAMSGLNLFSKITVLWQRQYNDDTNRFPLTSTFLNNIAAQDLMFNSDNIYRDWQAGYGNIPNYNTSMDYYAVDNTNSTSPSNDFKMLNDLKLHNHAATDAPANISTVDAKLNAGVALNGKLHSITLPVFPFTPTTKYLQEQYNLPEKIILPPYTYIRVILEKTKIPYINLMNNKQVTLAQNIKNTPISYSGVVTDIYIKIHALYFQIEKYKPLTPLYTNATLNFNYSYNSIDFQKLSSNTTQEYRLQWDGDVIPNYCYLYFLRDYDLLYNANTKLTISNDKFLLPEHLDEISLTHIDWQNTIFDLVKLKNLNNLKKDPTKINYLAYLKLNGFIPKTLKYHEYFSTTELTGFQNCFPIKMTGRGLNNSLVSRGFNVLLQYKNSNTTNWYLVVRWVFCNTVNILQTKENICIKFNQT